MARLSRRRMRCVAMPKPPPAMPPAMPHGACSYFPRCDAPTVLHASPRLRRAPRCAGREATTSAPCRQVWRAVRGGGAAARSEPRGRRHTDPGARRCAHSATPAARCRGAACASSHPPLSPRAPPAACCADTPRTARAHCAGRQTAASLRNCEGRDDVEGGDTAARGQPASR